MIIPIRCFSCGKVVYLSPGPKALTDFVQVVGDLWEKYLDAIDNDKSDA